MIIIRELQDIDLLPAIQLKALCWPEELAEMSDKSIDMEKELAFWSDWMHSGIEHNDVRSLIGAFEEDRLLGVAFASFSEKEDSECGIELNGLWVYPDMRGKGISLMLMSKLLHYYQGLGLREIVIYNYHHSSSNTYYQKLGAKVINTMFQMEERIPTDIFRCDIETMLSVVDESLAKYDN